MKKIEITATPEPYTAQEIHPDVLYRLGEIKKRTGMRNCALRSARKAGLKVIYRNGRAWVMGHDFIAYVTGNIVS